MEVPLQKKKNQAKTEEGKLNQAIKPNPYREPKKLTDEFGNPRAPILLKFTKKTANTEEKENTKEDTPLQKRTRAGRKGKKKDK